MRCTLETDTPLTLDVPRELQRMASAGRLSNVCTMIASMRSSSIERGAPQRGFVVQPSTPCSTERRRHLPTVACANPKSAAMSLFCLPSAHARTIRARIASACAVLRRDASDCNFKRYRSSKTKAASCQPATQNSISDAKTHGTEMRIYRESNVANF